MCPPMVHCTQHNAAAGVAWIFATGFAALGASRAAWRPLAFLPVAAQTRGPTVRDTSHLHSFVGGICHCGLHAAQGFSAEAVVSDQIDTALVHGLFPDPVLRRTLLKTVGATVLLGALSSILPVDTLKAIAQERKPLEKTKLNVGFLPITCADPLIYGEKLGSYPQEGLEVTLQKIAGIALIRDKMINGELDVSQQVMPVPLTMTRGTWRQCPIDQGTYDPQSERQLARPGQ